MQGSFVANGNINVSRFVMLDTTADGKVIEATAGAKIKGVSQQGTRNTPYSSLDDGYAAIAGENIHVYEDNEECWLEAGGTITRGDRLKATTGGKGLATTTDHDEYGAEALESGTSGKLIRVRVRRGQISA